ncbi:MULTISPECIES: patatin-like phospholipase RssA [unclassified Brenneria]|uniref:patatin-like phospholipase RssA n=1 Tax=unclassified Brenneria TaxID=2634434 RepID=UPI0029C55750|nr:MULTISPECIES: patatin-like phospholipase RssA [unclassified Brenneria]MDX5626804.1 patatin-like phospholipase RssA [Brenneria sp. L3-3Z]MDX5693846.1 patatin-like phospholipase RssA [Brenneria sp. L4-2C]MEE3661513.1 patatin-like phospholipase RssA [Brenneria sp. g21c3]
MRRIKVGLALSSGAAKGWAHIGVINALTELGIEIDVVAGCSVGALVGAAYATHRLDAMERWVSGFGYWDVIRLMDLSWQRGGLLRGDKVFNNVKNLLRTKQIEDCAIKYGVVATNLSTGRELWLTEGDLHQSIRASCSIPGLLSPVLFNGYWLVDGAVVNPVPVSLARAMGADVVIAVDLQQDASLDHHDLLSIKPTAPNSEVEPDVDDWRRKIRKRLSQGRRRQTVLSPTAMEIMSTSIHILENRLKMTRMAGDPPDVLVQPYCPQIATLDFHRAQETIAAGRQAVAKKRDELLSLANRAR